MYALTNNSTKEKGSQYPVSISRWISQYKGHMDFVIKRYGLPVEPEDWLSTQGRLVRNILTHQNLANPEDHAVMFIFLVMNVYLLGPRIIREYFIHVHDETPKYSESGYQKWTLLQQLCEEIIRKGVTYHDIAAGRPVKARMEVFKSNLDRILK